MRLSNQSDYSLLDILVCLWMALEVWDWPIRFRLEGSFPETEGNNVTQIGSISHHQPHQQAQLRSHKFGCLVLNIFICEDVLFDCMPLKLKIFKLHPYLREKIQSLITIRYFSYVSSIVWESDTRASITHPRHDNSLYVLENIIPRLALIRSRIRHQTLHISGGDIGEDATRSDVL